jgi:hypothetical protein
MSLEIYRRIATGQAHGLGAPVGGTLLAQASNYLAKDPLNLGLQIMVQAHTAGYTMPNDMAALVTLFKQVIAPHFEWRPKHGGSDGGAVLDGTKKFGECAYLAHALFLLLTAPVPFGFGLVAGPGLKVETYEGASDEGFIADHVGIHYGLSSNTVDPANSARLNLYRWGDHKVVRYHGSFWDQCYDAQYAQLSDMARWNITATDLVFGGRNMQFTTTNGVNTRYFIMNDRYPGLQWCTTIGPYAAPPGPPALPAQQPPRVHRGSGGTCNIL